MWIRAHSTGACLPWYSSHVVSVTILLSFEFAYIIGRLFILLFSVWYFPSADDVCLVLEQIADPMIQKELGKVSLPNITYHVSGLNFDIFLTQ